MVSTTAANRAASITESSTSRDTVVARYSGLWAREGDIILNAQGGSFQSVENFIPPIAFERSIKDSFHGQRL